MINTEQLLEAIEQIAGEKGISKDEIAEGIGEGMRKAFERFFDTEAVTEADVDLEKGTIEMYLVLKVVQQVEDDWLEIGINEAKKEFGENVAIGDEVKRPIEFTQEFSRLAVHQVRQNIQQRIRATERERIYNQFIDDEHELLTGKVIGMNEQGNAYLLQLDGTVASIWSKKLMPGDEFHIDDFVTFYVEEVKPEDRFSQIVASRTAPGFLVKTLETEVPEIAEGIIEIKGVSREPGRRAKLAVHSIDPDVEPIGAIVGARGSRINRVSEQLHGEKIDVVEWNEDTKTYIMNAMAPVRVVSVDIDEENNEVDVIVPNEQLSLAIGKGGMAARLVANLIKMKINIISVKQAAELGITNFWNGNITEAELESKDFLENVNRRTKPNNRFRDDSRNDAGKTYARRSNTMDELMEELAKFQSEINEENERINDNEFEYEDDGDVKEEVEKAEEMVEETEQSLDEIQANLQAFEEASNDEDEDYDDDEDIEDEDYDKYYN